MYSYNALLHVLKNNPPGQYSTMAEPWAHLIGKINNNIFEYNANKILLPVKLGTVHRISKVSVLLRARELIGLCVAKLLITVDNLIQPKKDFVLSFSF